MFANHPKIAREFEAATPKDAKLPPKKGYIRTSDGMMKVKRKKA